jgi:hypothetical protein
MRLLFLHPNFPDYAGDGLMHGLRCRLGNALVDLPRVDYMYDDYPAEKWKGVANEGKTLYGLLKDNRELENARADGWDDLKSFAFIIISNPFGFGLRLKKILDHLHKWKALNKIVWVDGSDTNRLFPFSNLKHVWPKWLGILQISMQHSLYFKREFAGMQQGIPAPFIYFKRKYHIYPFGISIPGQWIEKIPVKNKSRLFPSYLVDEEVAHETQGKFGPIGAHKFLFNTQEQYFSDIATAKFGITTRRAGWDALRHYEYAAKGAVLCFKNLDKKPRGNAPHGLSAINCITYHSYASLQKVMDSLSDQDYITLQENTYAWVSNHTTEQEADRFLQILAQTDTLKGKHD